VLSELFDEPTIAVDTHVERVSKRLGLSRKNDDVTKVENKLKKYFDKNEYNRVNHQLLLFGRYIYLYKNYVDSSNIKKLETETKKQLEENIKKNKKNEKDDKDSSEKEGK
jgi:endonuclease III